MSEIEQIDFSTLIWVKKELDETLSRAQSAIEAYVENPEDENQLQFCATYLHQVQGTLKMVELYGAAMVAEEMEQVATKILDKEVDSEKDAFEVLTRGILLLPDYLERIQLGHKDIPMVLLPLVNDLRTVKGDQLLSESALFNPNLSLGIPESNYNASFVLSENQLTQVVNKIRSVYQVSLLNWLKGNDVEANLKKIQTILDKLKTVVLEKDEKQMFWVAGGLFEALINGSLERSVTVKQLAARLDQAIRVIVSSDKNSVERPYKKITKNLLYYVALAQSNDRRIKEIQTFFNLSDFISDESEIEHAKTSLSGKNKELLESVTTVIKEDLMSAQENLDLYNRNENADNSEMKQILDSLNKISDTLGIIGVGVARSRIKNVAESVEKEIEDSEKVSKDSLMKIAETVLFVNSALDENILSLGEISDVDRDSESNIASSEIRKIQDVLAQESINSLQKVKQNFIQYIESSWNQEYLKSSPKLLKQISGALKMSGFLEVSKEIEKIEDYTLNHMLKSDYVPDVEKLDILAEAIASLEYYLEYLSEGTKGEKSILELAQSNINKLFEPAALKNEEVGLSGISEQLDESNELENKLEDEFELSTVSELSSEGELSLEQELSSEDEISSEDELNSELDDIDEMDFDESFENTISEELGLSESVERLVVAFSDDTDDDIKEVFLEEFEEEVEHLNDIYPKWKNNPEEQFELLGEIRRIYHTLKGSGRLVGAMAIGDFSWKIEDMTNQVLNKTRDVSQSYLMVMDASKKILPSLYQALVNEAEVPAGYYAILKAAEAVIAGDTIEEIVFEETKKDKDISDKQIKPQVDFHDKDSEISEIDDKQIDEPETEDAESTIDDVSLSSEDLHEFDDDLSSLDEDLLGESDLSVDPVFVEILQQEVEGHLKDIGEYLEDCKKSGNCVPTEKFIRVVHTLNGAANMASVNSIVSMTTPLELFAKSVLDAEKEFDEESIQQIKKFKKESEKIMKDLSHLSTPTEEINQIGSFFKNATVVINQELDASEEDLSDFDLKQFIDETENEDELSNIDLMSEFDDLENEINAIQSEECESLGELSNVDEELNLTLEIDDLKLDESTHEDSSEITEEITLDSEEEMELDLDLEFETDEDDLDSTDEITFDSEKESEEETFEEELPKDEALNLTGQEHISASVPTSYDSQTETSEQESSEEFDEELLEIFQEEADDILDRTEHVLSDLEEQPNDFTLIEALQRDLHTLKGGSRMAGLSNIGELSHVLESLLEKIGEDRKEVDNQTFSIIHDSFDTLNKLKNESDFGQKTDISLSIKKVKSLLELSDDIVPEKSKLDIGEFDAVDPMLSKTGEDVEADETAVKVASKKSNVLSGNQIKVNSELLDNLVNYAGEVSIYRSRLEQEVGSFRVNLSELGNTVARIREQLRKLDAETEAQIISTFQIEESGEDFDPLEMDRFSQLQQLSRSLTESVSDLTSIHSYLDDVARKSDNLLTQQSRVNAELQDGLMETRLVSFNSIVPRLRRLVRTTSKELKKSVKLDVHGAEGEMDKTVLEGVIAPLEHMIRNALAHGIESNRKKATKSDTGRISLDLRREATEVVITVTDDGAGINRDRVKQIAIEKGIIDKDKKISESDIDRLILHSGFSTVDKVSKVAGRGVGMDVVVNQINLLGGSLDISSETGKGTRFIIRLPYTLALSNALLVEVAEQVYAVPISGLEGVIRMSYSDYLQRLKDGNMVYNYANEEYQIYELNKLLDIDADVAVENNQIPLVMIRSGEDGVALRVDKVLGSREIVVKNVGAQISSVPGIYGATILGDGNVILILDVIPLSRSYVKKLKVMEESGYVTEEVEVSRDPIIMIVDDSITMRKVGERILRRNDYDVVTAKDGIDALEKLKEVVPDVMLLDIEMPRMDGYELAIEMKKIENYANVPIIMITSRTGEKHRQKAMDLGVNRYLGKPYQEADLLENISELIEEFKN